ncbi:MAG: formylmethanofuran dehydrogenase subunit E family protein [Phycisphaerales bacterium]|nr:MAG: formylmethanofuran dehydrogenase subunit E family protein [Phycisphaerales bacterium]
MKSVSFIVSIVVICGLVFAASDPAHQFTGAVGGDNDYNKGRAPEDWWGEIQRMHGHVGPWNVLGWRIGKAALKEFSTEWGRHELDIICYVPIKTPYSCMADGLVIGTGNSIGRLDLRLAEVISLDLIHVCIRRKDGAGPILIVKPRRPYLRRIDAPEPEALERLSRECSDMEESDLFTIERIPASKIQN